MFDIIFAKIFTVLLVTGIISLIISTVYGLGAVAYLGMSIIVILLCVAVAFMAKVFIEKMEDGSD